MLAENIIKSYSKIHTHQVYTNNNSVSFDGSQIQFEFFKAWEYIDNYYKTNIPKKLTFLEVGAWKGVWGIAFIEFCKQYKIEGEYTTITLIDLDVNNNFLYNTMSFIKNEGFVANLIDMNTADTNSLSEVKKYGNAFNIVFIDAGHKYYEIKNDIDKFASLATDLLLFHDIRPRIETPECGVYCAIKDSNIILDEEISVDETQMGIGVKYIKMNELYIKYKKHLENCFISADKLKSNIDDGIVNMDGMTGLKTRHLYNNILSMNDSRYLEIGVWKGSSVCSAMCGNVSTVLCIDNWSQFNEDGNIKTEFLKNFNKYSGNNNAQYLEGDCFNIDITNFEKFNIFMYDGDHSETSHYNALHYYYSCLDDVFIYIVDDWNWNSVREGTMNAIQKLNLKILWKNEIQMTYNNHHTIESLGKEIADTTWWNGIAVFILKKYENNFFNC